MQDLNLFEIFVKRLISINIEFVISGSVASIVYGDPRLTHDIDLVIELSKSQAGNLKNVFPDDEFYLPPNEVLNIEINRASRGHFNIIHIPSGFKADIYLAGSSEFSKWAIDNLKEIKFGESIFPVAPIEYVIIKKLEFYKEGKAQKHLNDIAAMLRESGDIIDYNCIDKKLIEFGLVNEWEEAKNYNKQ